MNQDFKVVYIAGNGHSGSTLLDILLGNGDGCFSVGELSFIIRSGLGEEYCSCHAKISECDFWKNVHQIWFEKMTITFDEYRLLRHRYERNATFLRTAFNSFLPSKRFQAYKKTQLFFLRVFTRCQGQVSLSTLLNPLNESLF